MLENLRGFFTPLDYAPWGTGNPVYFLVPALFIALCIAVYATGRHRGKNVPEEVSPTCIPPDPDAGLVAALKHLRGTGRRGLRGCADTVVATLVELVGTGVLRVKRVSGDLSADGPGPDAVLVLAPDADPSPVQAAVLGLLFPEGKRSVVLGEWVDRGRKGSGFVNQARDLMEVARRQAVATGLAAGRPVARILISGPLCLFTVLWSIFLVPAAAGIGGGVVTGIATMVVASTLGDTAPVLTPRGSDALARARGNLAWAESAAAQRSLPEDTPGGADLAWLLASVVAVGGGTYASAVAKLLSWRHRDEGGSDDPVERQLVALLAPPDDRGRGPGAYVYGDGRRSVAGGILMHLQGVQNIDNG